MFNQRIAKADLVDGHYYWNHNKGRGMKVGRWTAEKNCFLCIKPPKFGQYDLWELPHFEDDRGTAIFEPVLDITKLCEKNLP